MENFSKVIEKLEKFIRKFYVNELIKGVILFFSLGLLYFIITVALEYFFWLTSFGRSFLFWSFIAVEFGLFVRFIIYPVLKLFKLSKGLNFYKASEIIGTHFPQVSDKLTNVLQLKESGANSDLLIASIEQKAEEIQPVPFHLAINFKNNLKYSKYLALPLLIILLVWVSGKLNLFTDSYQRVVDYKTAYTPPAPFKFVILNSNLEAEEGKNFLLRVFTEGEYVPEEVQVRYENQAYYLKKNTKGQFEYEFDNLNESVEFKLSSNEVVSSNYVINLIEVPKITDLSMQLNFPSYTQFEAKQIKATGNAQIPEGTVITWNLATENTEKIKLQIRDSIYYLQRKNNVFQFEKKVGNSFTYQLSTSNSNRSNYENLGFEIEVIKDEYPNLSLINKKDSIAIKTTYFQGKASDDYGLTKLQLVYYNTQNPADKKSVPIEIARNNYTEFVYAFPNSNLDFNEGESYTYYFEVFDNDGVNGRKSTKSSYFTYRKPTVQEVKKEKLNQQSESIKGMEKSLKKQQSEVQSLKEIQQLQKEKNTLSFSDKKKIENYLKRQQQQREMMKNYTKSLKENLEKFDPENKDAEKEDLIERLEQNEERLEESERLMQELDEYREKLEDENLDEKLKQAANESKKQERTLQQLLELTKRYYVERKTEQLAEELNELAKKQEELSEKEEAKKESQDKLNSEFERLKEELEKLEEENNNLKKPMDLFRDPYTEEEIKEEMQEASELIKKEENSENNNSNASKKEGEIKQTTESEKQEGKENEEKEGEKSEELESSEDNKEEEDNGKTPSGAQKKQKSAAQKMKELSQKMGMSMMAGGQEQQSEDAETLKRILQNLLKFSFEQESLMIAFDNVKDNNAQFAENLKKQADLRENFKHIDDSLFSLALRNQMIGEEVTRKITDIEYNTEQSLERLADNKINLGQSNQQYVMTIANDLANLLDDALDNMQDQLGSGSGSGKSGKGQSGDKPGDQLSDIIKSHEELKKQMQKAMGKSPGEGEQGEDGESEGNKGGEKEGKQGENGNKKNSSGKLNEQMSGELYEIFKKQQALKQQLEDRIESLGIESESGNLRKSIEQLEEELLMKGFSSNVLKQMKNINHQLLKLKEAAQKQGQEEKRQATANDKEFENKVKDELERAKEYFNTIEILNRQQLPLQPKYKNLIKNYFDVQNNSIQ